MKEMRKVLFLFLFVIHFLHSEKLIKRLDPGTVVIESKNGPVTVGDLSNTDLILDRYEENLFDFYQKSAEQKLLENILTKKAKAKSLPDAEAFMKDFEQKVTASSSELKEYKEKNKAQLIVFDPVTKEQRSMVDAEIKEKLLSEKRLQAKRDFFNKLLAEAKVKRVLDKDPIVVPVSKNNPSKGADKAEVVLHAFSDFQCPYCAKVSKELTQLMDKHKNNLKVYFHHYPLSFHRLAKPAAIASYCAQEQGKFWQFHDAVFSLSQLKADSFGEIAKTLKLDSANFEKCLQNPVVATFVDDEILKAQKLGIQSTPSFIVGSKRFAGYKSLSELESITGLK